MSVRFQGLRGPHVVGTFVKREASGEVGRMARPARFTWTHQARRVMAGPMTLLAYLDDAPESIRREFVEVYLQNRGHRYEEKATIHFREDRTPAYLEELAALIAGVSGERVTVSERNVIISAAAARALNT